MERDRRQEQRIAANLARQFGAAAESAVDSLAMGRSMVAWSAVYACDLHGTPDAKILTAIYTELGGLLDRLAAVGRMAEDMSKEEFRGCCVAIKADIEAIRRYSCMSRPKKRTGK
jgi:hypothetical protein